MILGLLKAVVFVLRNRFPCWHSSVTNQCVVQCQKVTSEARFNKLSSVCYLQRSILQQ